MILTIAKHTFREAIRKKIVHLLIGLGIIIIAISPYIPTTDEPDAKVKMIFVVFFQVVALLCTIGIILLSASSLPNEIEDKTIYGILSKPVSRLKIVAGKIAGFSALSALLVVVLGVINAAVIHQAALRLPQDYSGIVKARSEFWASQLSIQGDLHHSRQGIKWIEGGSTGVAVWHFSGLGNKGNGRLPFEAELALKIETAGAWMKRFR
ncbi:MAG: ABC transporter permease [Planctomycetota bacterium]